MKIGREDHDMEEKQIVCPYCGKTDFIEAHAAPVADIAQTSLFTMKLATIKYKVCISCGTIAHLYVDDPKKLLTKSQLAALSEKTDP